MTEKTVSDADWAANLSVADLDVLLERCLQARDFQGLSATLHLMAVKDPQRAERWRETLLLAVAVRRESGPTAKGDGRDMSTRIRAPWTVEQVAALNAFQSAGRMHPFTCGGRHERHVSLLATEDGWVCPVGCGYTQTWAHAFMVDPTLAEPLDMGFLS